MRSVSIHDIDRIESLDRMIRDCERDIKGEYLIIEMSKQKIDQLQFIIKDLTAQRESLFWTGA